MRCKISLPAVHGAAALAVILFVGVEAMRYFSFSAPNWVYNYLNDFLCIPIVATLSLHGVWGIKGDKRIRINRWAVLGLVALFSVYFEIYLPQLSDRYTGDILDVICYVLGGTVFYMLQKIE